MKALHKYLRKAGWRSNGDGEWQSPTGRRFFVIGEELSRAWDRFLTAKLAEGILRARAHAPVGTEPLIYLVAQRATPLLDKRLAAFALEVAPAAQWLLLDTDGSVFPHASLAPELEVVVGRAAPKVATHRSVNLFSDLNQWMLKVLLSPHIPSTKLTRAAPAQLRSVSVLAEAARVSLPAASRLVSELDSRGMLDRSHGDFRLSEPRSFLEFWASKGGSGAAEDVGGTFVRGKLNDDAFRMLMSAARQTADASGWWCVVGLFDACAALGLGHVKGAPRMLYVSSFDRPRLEQLGITVGGVLGSPADLILCLPRYPESIRRGAVEAGGMLVTDVVQCWLDAKNHALRGQEQAAFLERRFFDPTFEGR